MNDPIKKFVHEHREAFDHLEPSDAVLQRLKDRLKPTPVVVRKSFFQRHPSAKWLVAASLLAGVLCAYWLLDGGKAMYPEAPRFAQQSKQQALPADTPNAPAADERTAALPVVREDPSQGSEEEQPRRIAVAETPAPRPPSLASRLADSSSASVRLAAILEIEQSRRMNDQLVAMLSETMNRDGNTNVRLAALDVLSQHLHEPTVTEVFTASLTMQDDPLVQLGLVKVVGQLDNTDIEETLFALVRDPYTFAAVKDEAYAVLLRQNKL